MNSKQNADHLDNLIININTFLPIFLFLRERGEGGALFLGADGSTSALFSSLYNTSTNNFKGNIRFLNA